MGVHDTNGVRTMLIESLQCLNQPMPNVRICEFGDQRLKIFRRKTLKFFQAHRTLFDYFGAYYVSIDLNGKWGALPFDLGVPLVELGFDERLLGTFNLVTDWGTVEHVVDGQAHAFRNAHDLCSVNGLMTHSLPTPDLQHGDWQYSLEWLKRLGHHQGYVIEKLYLPTKKEIWDKIPEESRPPGWTENKVHGELSCAIYRKVSRKPFNYDVWEDPTPSLAPGKRWQASPGAKTKG